MFGATDYWISIAELPSFSVDASRIFSESEKDELFQSIAGSPAEGLIIPGTGGVRKIRWSCRGHGKQTGARVIYYFRDLNMPVFLLAVYAKGEKLNLSQKEKAQMNSLVDTLVSEWLGGRLSRVALIPSRAS